MPGMPRPDSKATKIALQILGRKMPRKGKTSVPTPVGPKPIPKTFDGSLG